MSANLLLDVHVNPARAGMILDFEALLGLLQGKPRASGDDPRPATMSQGHRR